MFVTGFDRWLKKLYTRGLAASVVLAFAISLVLASAPSSALSLTAAADGLQHVALRRERELLQRPGRLPCLQHFGPSSSGVRRRLEQQFAQHAGQARRDRQRR